MLCEELTCTRGIRLGAVPDVMKEMNEAGKVRETEKNETI